MWPCVYLAIALCLSLTLLATVESEANGKPGGGASPGVGEGGLAQKQLPTSLPCLRPTHLPQHCCQRRPEGDC